MQIRTAFLSCALALLFTAVPKADTQAKGGLADAMLELASGHESEYRLQIQRLCESGNLEAQQAYGRFLIYKQEYSDAERWLTLAAKSGASESQYLLGLLYLQVLPPRIEDAKLWIERASKQGHPRAISVMQLFQTEPRKGPPNRVSVLDILESASSMAKVKVDTMPERDIRCAGHTENSFKLASIAALNSCLSEVHQAFGDWVAPEQAKAVGMQWAQCTRREVLRSSAVSQESFAKCVWSRPQ